MESSEFDAIMSIVYRAIKEKNQHPIYQLMGYIFYNDPKYITNKYQARALVKKLGREELMYDILSYYFSSKMPWTKPIPPPAHKKSKGKAEGGGSEEARENAENHWTSDG